MILGFELVYGGTLRSSVASLAEEMQLAVLTSVY